MKLDSLFADSFDTFKVFDNLNTEQVSLTNNNSPKSVWQILNHLLIWHDHQINQLLGKGASDINETDTWLADKTIADQHILTESITKLKRQIETVKTIIATFTFDQKDIAEKLKVVQDLTIHLSFHLGEIVLILRQNGHYPMPHEMKAFLASK